MVWTPEKGLVLLAAPVSCAFETKFAFKDAPLAWWWLKIVLLPKPAVLVVAYSLL